MPNDPRVKTYLFKDDGSIPNNPGLPLLYYEGVLSTDQRSAGACRELFARHNWRNSWVNGVYTFHHYHSITHEVLGITAGKATLILGGKQGEEISVEAGDVIVIPAGVGHFNKNSSRDFEVVGAYPDGMSWDMCYGKPEERPEKIEHIKEVPMPETDPVFGKEGPLLEKWS